MISEAYSDPTMLIDRFEGKDGWLSNFHTHPVYSTTSVPLG